MTQYAAFLRGIMPMNPNMRNEKLRSVFEKLGFKHVHSIISSGNLIFESKILNDVKNIAKLEVNIEKALFKQLGIKCPAFIRSREDLEKLIKKNPFKKAVHSRQTYLMVTFRKKNAKKPYEIFNTIDLGDPGASEMMGQLEKKHGREITTRTWKTVQRILKRMEDSESGK